MTPPPNCFTRLASKLAASGGAVPCCTDPTRAPAMGPATAVASSCWSPAVCRRRASTTSPARLNCVTDVEAEAESAEGLLNRNFRSSAIAPPTWFATTDGSHDKVPEQGPHQSLSRRKKSCSFDTCGTTDCMQANAMSGFSLSRHYALWSFCFNAAIGIRVLVNTIQTASLSLCHSACPTLKTVTKVHAVTWRSTGSCQHALTSLQGTKNMHVQWYAHACLDTWTAMSQGSITYHCGRCSVAHPCKQTRAKLSFSSPDTNRSHRRSCHDYLSVAQSV